MDPARPPAAFLGVSSPLRHLPADIRARAEELLSRPPYVQEDGGIGRLLRRLGDHVAGFLQRLVGALSGDPFVAWLIVIIGVLVLGAVVWRATRGSSLDRDTTGAVHPVVARSAASWHAEADEHEVGGRAREALRCRYAAVVSALVEGGVIDERPGRTVRELDAEVAVHAPRLAAAIREVGARFEAVIYGRATATADDLELARRVAREADAAARQPIGVATAGPVVPGSQGG